MTSAGAAPGCTLAAASTAIVDRVERLLGTPSWSGSTAGAAIALAVCIVALPVAVMLAA